MAQVIGNISEVSGLFYAKDSGGETRLLKVGDELFLGEVVVGDSSNSVGDVLKLSVEGSGKEISVLSNNQLLLDDTILPVELASDSVVEPQDIEEALMLDATYSDEELAAAATEDETITDAESFDDAEAPAAGDAEVDTLVGRFSDRTGDETDITTDLRDATFTDPTVEIVDDVAQLGDAVLTLTATPQLTEDGGIIVYTVTVNNTPQSDMIVTLSNGETITIAAGTTSGSTSVTVTEAEFEDVYVDSDVINVSITGSTDGNFVNIDFTTNGDASTAIVDTIDTTTVTVTNISEETITEDSTSITYEVSVDNPVTDTPLEVTVELLDGDTDDVIGVDTIIIPVGATSASAEIELTEDYSDVYNDSGSVEAVIIGTTGGNFEALDTSSVDVTSLVETIDDTNIVLSATPTLTEAGGTITYTATIEGTNPATQDVAVTLDNGGSITIHAYEAGVYDGFTGTTTDTVTATEYEDVYKDSDTINVKITAAIQDTTTTAGDFENITFDPDAAATTTIADTVDDTNIVLSATPTLTEAGGTITYTATIEGTNPATQDVAVTLDN
ncbi:MAG: immunoglobulin-like domain-containing protein, partial [Campylobacterota bacterium]|nr:immunoglobulin-like domain-containing protein [Campylobacterota bacterium]